jgi:hypothetical protein
VKLLDDGWTAVTRDRSLSAQFEHSIGITETGCEIFTPSRQGGVSAFSGGCGRSGNQRDEATRRFGSWCIHQ